MGRDKKDWPRNTAGLQEHVRQKALQTRQRVTEAIDKLLEKGETVNFNTVSHRAGVTKAYLYAQSDLRERIAALRVQQGQDRQCLMSAPREVGRTDKSKDVILEAKNRRIAQLEEENTRLKAELKAALGKLYERV